MQLGLRFIISIKLKINVVKTNKYKFKDQKWTKFFYAISKTSIFILHVKINYYLQNKDCRVRKSQYLYLIGIVYPKLPASCDYQWQTKRVVKRIISQ